MNNIDSFFTSELDKSLTGLPSDIIVGDSIHEIYPDILPCIWIKNDSNDLSSMSTIMLEDNKIISNVYDIFVMKNYKLLINSWMGLHSTKELILSIIKV
jgi:hypothetical protein